MPSTFMHQVIDQIVDEALYTGASLEADLTVDGVVATDVVDFKNRLANKLLAAGDGSGGTPGIDDVLAQEQTVSSRFIEVQVDGLFEIVVDSTRNLLELDTTVNSERSSLEASNVTGGGNKAYFEGLTTASTGEFTVQAGVDDNAKKAQITGYAEVEGVSTLEYSADTHTFSGIGGDLLNMVSGQSNGQLGIFRTFGGTLAGESLLQIVNNDDDGGVHRFNLKSNAGGADVGILGDAIAQTITHTANVHTFNAGGNTSLVVNGTLGGQLSYLKAFNDNGSDFAGIESTTDNTVAATVLTASTDADANKATIEVVADASASSITHTADTHTFNGNFKSGTDNTWDLNGKFFKLWQVDDHVLLLDPNQFKALISATQGGESGTNSNLVLYADPLGEGVTAHLVSQTGGNNADILLDGANGTITSTADTHMFNNGVNENGKITNSESFIRGFNSTDNGNYGLVRGEANVADTAALIEANFNGDTKVARVRVFADATTATIIASAADGFFIESLAGGGTTGLSIDNDGKIIRTP